MEQLQLIAAMSGGHFLDNKANLDLREDFHQQGLNLFLLPQNTREVVHLDPLLILERIV